MIWRFYSGTVSFTINFFLIAFLFLIAAFFQHFIFFPSSLHLTRALQGSPFLSPAPSSSYSAAFHLSFPISWLPLVSVLQTTSYMQYIHAANSHLTKKLLPYQALWKFGFLSIILAIWSTFCWPSLLTGSAYLISLLGTWLRLWSCLFS